MRKHLASHAEVAHYWANASQHEGKCGNMFFEGRLIYSYGHHFVLARRTDKEDERGTRIVLINASRYSTSTGQHLGLVRRAASHFRQITVPYPATNTPDAGELNMMHLNAEIIGATNKMKRAKTSIRRLEEVIHSAVADAATYHAVFAPDCPVRPLSPCRKTLPPSWAPRRSGNEYFIFLLRMRY